MDDYSGVEVFDLISTFWQDRYTKRLIKCFLKFFNRYPDAAEAEAIQKIEFYLETSQTYPMWSVLHKNPTQRIENLVLGVIAKNPSYFQFAYIFVAAYETDRPTSKYVKYPKPVKNIALDPERCDYFREIFISEFGIDNESAANQQLFYDDTRRDSEQVY